MTIEQINFIRELCADKFEGVPCQYPDCTCSPDNRREMETEYLARKESRK